MGARSRAPSLLLVAAVAGILLVACGAADKRALDGSTSCPRLDIPSEGTEQLYREYLRGLRSQPACAEAWEATLLVHIGEVSIQKDDTATGAQFVGLGTKVVRCSIEGRQCFVPVKLKRDPLGFASITATVKYKRIDHAVSVDLVRDGAVDVDSRFVNCQHGEACELPVDLLDLLRAPRGVIHVVATTRPTAEEIAHEKAEAIRLKEERFAACYEDCFTRANAPLKSQGQAQLSKLYLRWFDRTESKRCRIECTPPIGTEASK